MATGSLIFLGVTLLLFTYIITTYNKLITLKNRFKNAFSQIDIQLQRRHDLIPNLVETAKAYMTHEQETLEKVIQARNQAVSATSSAAKNPDDPAAIKALQKTQGALSGSLANFFALSETYPELKADSTMAQLSAELTSTENRVGFSRQAFNDAIMIYNTYREQFPSNIIAGLASFQAALSFEVDEPEVKNTVRISFQ